MEPFARFIHKSNISYLPTKLPAQFYGLPDGKVYIVYARFYQVKFERSGLEYVFATHGDFTYDYENGKLATMDESTLISPMYNEMVDKPDLNFKILKVYRNINSYSEAINYLNCWARELIAEKKLIERTE
jgi:hypothetical protein